MITRILLAVMALFSITAFSGEAQARAQHRHYQHVRHYSVPAKAQVVNLGIFGCTDNNGRWFACPQAAPARRGAVRTAYQTTTPRAQRAITNEYEGERISYGGYSAGSRPAGCPHAGCGCGTSLRVFGKIIPRYNLASNWSDFPPAMPGPGMVAYRSGHVKVITGGGPGGYTCYDPNSGGGVAHSGPCSIAGYHVVNPHAGSRYARL